MFLNFNLLFFKQLKSLSYHLNCCLLRLLKHTLLDLLDQGYLVVMVIRLFFQALLASKLVNLPRFLS